MKVTIDEVAKKAGVSKTTVSRILNGRYEYATEQTRNRVLEVIRELDYRPNALAKGLKQAKTNVIGIVLSNLQNPFWARVLEGVEDGCRHLGYSLMITNSNEDAQLEEDYIKSLQTRQVDGLIINPTVKNFALYESLVDGGFPMVAINRKLERISIDTIAMDNIMGASTAVEHLIVKSGRKNIALLVYPPDGVSPRIERIEGYKQGLRKQGMEVQDSLIHIVPEIKGEVKKLTQSLLRQSGAIDAILSTNNMMTIEVMEGIKELGLRMPEDIALVGYDETVWSKHLNPPLTTVNQPAYEMGELAAKQLIKRIESKKALKTKCITLEPNLIVRESCGAKQ